MSDDVFSHSKTSYSHQNGNYRSSVNSRATMESIKSVHDNPFYKNFGIRHNIPSHSRTSHNSSGDVEMRKRLSSNGRSSSVDDDEIGEYRPGSGYVHKLLDKFTSLTANADQGLYPLKRSSSVDEITGDNELKTKSGNAHDVGPTYVVTTVEKPSFLSSAKLSHKARSIESLNHVHRRPYAHQYHHPHLRHVETKWEKEKQLPPKSPRDSHVVAPDVELARDDIVIIENTPPVPALTGLDGEGSESEDGTPQLISHREMLPQDELPKPNTVLTVRSLFENVSSHSSGNGLSILRTKTDAASSSSSPTSILSPSSTEIIPTFNHDSGPSRVSIRSPSSPVTSPRFPSTDTHVKPVLLPSNVTTSKSSEFSRRSVDMSSYSHSSRLDDKPTSPSFLNVSGTSKPWNSIKESTPRSEENSEIAAVSVTLDTKTSNFERGSGFDNSRTSDILRPTPSPRSTASVKPTFPSRPSAPVKPVPLSAPASAAISYGGSSPVVPVAPYKDQPENVKDEGQPVMIFSKSKLSPRREKQQRTKDYGPLKDNVQKTDKEALTKEKDVIISTESKSRFKTNENAKSEPETNNRLLSQRRRQQVDSGSKISERAPSDQSRIIHSKQQTTIEIRKPAKLSQGNEVSDTTPKDGGKAVELKRVKPVVTNRSGFAERSKLKNMAPEPPKSQSMLYVSSSETTSESDSTPPVTPRTKPTAEMVKLTSDLGSVDTAMPETPRGKTSDRSGLLEASDSAKLVVSKERAKTNDVKTEDQNEDQPVRGIPSIIAQRLKQQSAHPSQVADDVVSSSAATSTDINKVQDDHSSTDNELSSPRKRLTPPAAFNSSTASSSNSTSKDSLGSEIENEIAAVRRKMEENRPRSGGPAQIFDSSQLAKKRKENQRQRAANQGVVPLLDLSGLNEDKAKDYQSKPKEIKPCNIVFIGENAKTSRSLLAKKRRVKVSIHFNDAKTETFEYPSEEVALEKYLEKHPHEASEILILDNFGGGPEESSDETVAVIQVPVTPRGDKDEDLLRSNTALTASGSLQSYRGRYSQEFEFGVSLKEPEQAPPQPTEPAVDPASLMLRPAEEDDSNTWSTNSSSDLLF